MIVERPQDQMTLDQIDAALADKSLSFSRRWTAFTALLSYDLVSQAIPRWENILKQEGSGGLQYFVLYALVQHRSVVSSEQFEGWCLFSLENGHSYCTRQVAAQALYDKVRWETASDKSRALSAIAKALDREKSWLARQEMEYLVAQLNRSLQTPDLS